MQEQPLISPEKMFVKIDEALLVFTSRDTDIDELVELVTQQCFEDFVLESRKLGLMVAAHLGDWIRSDVRELTLKRISGLDWQCAPKKRARTKKTPSRNGTGGGKK